MKKKNTLSAILLVDLSDVIESFLAYFQLHIYSPSDVLVRGSGLPPIHVISPDFGGSSRFGAFPPGLTLGRRNLLTRGFFQCHFSRIVFLSEHFIVYGSIYLANNLFTAQKCLTFIDLIDDH